LLLASLGWILPQGLFHKRLSLGLIVLLIIHQWNQTGFIKGATLTVFDVGQGLSALWMQADTRLLYDVGPRFEDKTVFSKAALPYMNALHIKSLNEVIVSHSDNDHSGGLVTVEQNYPKTHLISGQHLHSTLNQQPCFNEQQLVFGQTKVALFGLKKSSPSNTNYNDNNHSCVMMLSYQGHHILLTGDAETDREKMMVEDNQLEAVDVLVAPHHGSKTSSSQIFVDKVQPKAVIYSAGYKNRYKFPHTVVVKRYQAIGAKPYNSATGGAISCSWNATGEFNGCSNYREQLWGRWHFRP